MGKGEDLNQEIWQLFQNAGFSTHPNTADPSEYVVKLPENKERPVDLHARDANLNVTIIGSNRARKQYESFTDHMAGLRMLMEAAEAQAAVFVSSEKKITPADVSLAKTMGIAVWNRRDLEYYKAVVDALGVWAKYPIIHDLNIPTKEQTRKATTLGIKLRQPNTKFGPNVDLFMFSLPAEDLLKMCVVLRKAQGKKFAYQRILSSSRLPKIADFLGTPEALLPTNLVVHLSDNVSIQPIDASALKHADGSQIGLGFPEQEPVSLTFTLKYASLELIDGQHRLFAFTRATEEIRSQFNLAVLGLREMSEDRRSETFVSINDKAKRVDPNLVAYLRYRDDEQVCRNNADLMAIKLAVELNNTSPFEDAIRLDDLGSRPLTLKGVSSYDLRGLVGPKGYLRKAYPSNKSTLYLRVLRTYFSTVKSVFKEEWAHPETYIVRTNSGISAFLKLLKSILKTANKKVDHRTFRRYLKALKKNAKTWDKQKLRLELQKSYVGSQGWKDLHREMVKQIHKDYPTLQE